VLATILIFLGPAPLALVAVYHASRVHLNWNKGDIMSRYEAKEHSRKAKGWVKATSIVAAITWITAIIIMATN